MSQDQQTPAASGEPLFSGPVRLLLPLAVTKRKHGRKAEDAVAPATE
jgi:hypothetical protein